MPRTSRRSDSRLHRGRRLDVSLRADPRNYTFAAPAPLVERSKKWECPVRLDQGREGACVGFGAAHWYACLPWVQITTEKIARFFYQGAKENDEWPGEDYEGTSPNGLFRFLQHMGLIGRFYQVRSAVEAYKILSETGPLMMGARWREGCFEPDDNGYIYYHGAVQGGHFVCVNGVDFENKFVWIVQSWGRRHGIDGAVKLSFFDFEMMLNEGALIFWAEERSLAGLKPKPRRSFWKRLFGR